MVQPAERSNNPSTDHARVLHRRTSETLAAVADRLDSESAEGAFARGRVFELLAYYPEAEAAYTTAIALDPTLDEATARLALVYLKTNQVAKGLATATKLAARNPNLELDAMATEEHFSIFTILGNALLASKRVEEAGAAYEAALRLYEGDTHAAARLAQVRILLDDVAQAQGLRESFTKNPRFVDLGDSLDLADGNFRIKPFLSLDSLAASVLAANPGRPVVVDGEVRLAELVDGDDGWCSR